MSRGVGQTVVFRDRWDFEGFFDVFARAVERCGWLCHSYCLLPNHFHLVVETPAANLGRGMAVLNGRYAQRFNRRHDRVGHVFQGRFRSILVERGPYLLELTRYLALNPVRAGLCTAPAEWKWSSYPATVGAVARPAFLTADWVLGQFGDDERLAVLRYARFVAEGASEPPWRRVLGGLYLGSEAFAQRHAPGRPIRDVPRRNWQPVRPPLSELLAAGDAAAIHRAVVEFGYRLREIGEALGIHPTTVGRRLAQAELGASTHRRG